MDLHLLNEHSPEGRKVDHYSSEIELASMRQDTTADINVLSGGDRVKLLDNANTSYIAKRESVLKQYYRNLSVSAKPVWQKYAGRRPQSGTNSEASQSNEPTFRGWRKTVSLAAFVAALVLFVNASFAVIATVKYRPVDGVGTLYTGDCKLVKRWDTAIHLLINVIGTALLAASNFTMQCLSSPTRTEVDAAHARRKVMEIGVPSLTNLFGMKLWKGFLWSALCLSTLPLHLLWNSAILTTDSAFLFGYVIAEETFLSGAPYQATRQFAGGCAGSSSDAFTPNDTVANIYKGYQAQTYTKLSAKDCFNYYNVDYLDARRNLIIITTPNTSSHMGHCTYLGQQWNGSSVLDIGDYFFAGWGMVFTSTLYSKSVTTAVSDTGVPKVPDNVGKLINNAKKQVSSTGGWTLGDYPVEYCYSETVVEAQCKLQYVSYILYIVVVCNVIKCICMYLVARHLWNIDEPIMATIGDAVASFLQAPDETTQGMCLLDLTGLRKGVWKTPGGRSTKHEYDPIYKRKPKVRLYFATTLSRWWLTIVLCTTYLVIGITLFNLTFDLPTATSYNVSDALRQKFGEVNSAFVLGLGGGSGIGLINDVLVANSFQLALSTTHFLYNSLYTAQYSALEWAAFANDNRKSLRVTWPRGQQRSTYYLQLPWRYAAPLTAFSILMHFLISQSIFLARLMYINYDGTESDWSFTDVGYSPVAILISCCVGGGLILAQIIHACRPLSNRMPIHGNRSAVISAMCHPGSERTSSAGNEFSVRDESTSLATQLLMWGVTDEPVENRDVFSNDAYASNESFGHCTYTCDVVEAPRIGRAYR